MNVKHQHHDQSTSSPAKSREQEWPPRERRILCVVRWPVGGIRTYLNYNYPILAAAGYEFTVVGPATKEFRDFARESRDWGGAEFVGVPVNGTRCSLRSDVRRLLRNGRFALIHSQGISAGIQAVMANALISLPHVMTSHDVFRPVHSMGFGGRTRLRLLGWLLGQIDMIVTVGEEARRNHLEYIPRLAKNANRVVTIPQGIDSDWYAEADDMPPAGLKERLGLDPRTFLIGFLGRFMEQKGFLQLLDALETLQDAPPHNSYHIVAVGGGDFEVEYRSEVKRRGLGALVSFHGFVPDPRPVLRELDLLVIPSLWEALPMLPMEAMALGTPVLGTDCIGLHEVLTDTPATMVPAGDRDAMAQALTEAIDSQAKERSRLFAAEARRRFDVRVSSARLLQLLEELTSRAARRGA